MNKPAHTPGPWVATGNGIHKGTRCVALTHMEPFEQRATDARLIAAAPELLQALDELCQLVEDKFDWSAQYERAQMAISKATGNPVS